MKAGNTTKCSIFSKNTANSRSEYGWCMSSRAGTYELIDEPKPGALSRIAVKPFWPLLGIMLGGAWLSWPWFVLNGFAVGSPTRRRELVWAIAGLVGTFLLLFGLGILQERKILEGLALRFAVIGIVVFKLYVTYMLYTLQSRSFALYEYFGGQTINGFPVVLAGMFLGPPLIKQLPPILILILS